MVNNRYSICWDTFSSKFKEAQKELYKKSHFSDVTLVSDDMVQTKAHKTVLYSSSPIFKQLLLMNLNNDENQVLYLKGVKIEELEAILQFIYLGEAKVSEARIDLFIAAANDLDIIELNKNLELFNQGNDEIISPKKEIETPEILNNISNEKEKEVKSGLQETNVKFKCSECNSSFSQAKSMRKHLQSIHLGAKFPCSECEKIYNCIDNLNRHKKSVHQVIRFPCSICNSNFVEKRTLKKHILRNHQAQEIQSFSRDIEQNITK